MWEYINIFFLAFTACSLLLTHIVPQFNEAPVISVCRSFQFVL